MKAKKLEELKKRVADIAGAAERKDVDINSIYRNPKNDYPMGNIELLAQDIVMHGLLENLVVVADGEKYRLISGERRWRALKMIAEKTGDKQMIVPVLVYSELTEKQEMLLLDASNLQSRGVKGGETYIRDAVTRYINNLMDILELTETDALHMAFEMTGVSESTIRKNWNLGKNLSPAMTQKLDEGAIKKADAVAISSLPTDVQEDLAQKMDASPNPQEVVSQAVDEIKESKASEGKVKKADTKGEPKKEIPQKDDQPAQVTTTVLPQRVIERNGYLQKFENMISSIKTFQTPDMVAQIKRLDETAEEDGSETVILQIDRMMTELCGLKRAISEANGEIDLGIDPVYGHHRGNKDEEGYVEDADQ